MATPTAWPLALAGRGTEGGKGWRVGLPALPPSVFRLILSFLCRTPHHLLYNELWGSTLEGPGLQEEKIPATGRQCFAPGGPGLLDVMLL